MLCWFDWNRVRTPLGDRLERTLGIRGDLRVEPGHRVTAAGRWCRQLDLGQQRARNSRCTLIRSRHYNRTSLIGLPEAADGRYEAHIDGQFDQPLRLDGPTVKLTASGPNLGTLYRFFGIVLPDTPPFRLARTLTRTGATLAARQLTGAVGDIDLRDNLDIELMVRDLG